MSGISAAVSEAVRAQAPAEVQQLALPGLPLAAKAEAARDIEGGGAAGRGGRPKGALNRRTEEFVDYILSQYRSPLIALAETYSRSVDELRVELGCTKLEAFQLQQQAAKELAPYLHQKLPQAVQIDGKGLVALSIVDPAKLVELGVGDGSTGDALAIGGPLIARPGNAGNSEG